MNSSNERRTSILSAACCDFTCSTGTSALGAPSTSCVESFSSGDGFFLPFPNALHRADEVAPQAEELLPWVCWPIAPHPLPLAASAPHVARATSAAIAASAPHVARATSAAIAASVRG